MPGKYVNHCPPLEPGFGGNGFPQCLQRTRREVESTEPLPEFISGWQTDKEIGRDERLLDMSDVAERVKKIVVEHLGVEAEKVTDNASFIDDLGADSLDTVELVMAFEEEFGCEIPDDAAEHILTVGDAVKFLQKSANPA